MNFKRINLTNEIALKAFLNVTRRLLRRSLRLPNENGHKARQDCSLGVGYIHLFLFCLTNSFFNIIFFSLLDSDWLKSVPINP